MRKKRVLAAATGLVLVGAFLVALAGCGAQPKALVSHSEGDLAEPGELSPEPDSSDPASGEPNRAADPTAFPRGPDLSDFPPDRPEASPRLPEAEATSRDWPSVAVRPQPAPSPLDTEPAPRLAPIRPEPIPTAALPQPAGGARLPSGEAPRMIAPGDVSGQSPSFVAQPRPTAGDDSRPFAVRAQPMTAPEMMTAPLSPPDVTPREAMTIQPSPPLPEALPAERRPIAARTEGDRPAVPAPASGSSAEAASPEVTSEVGSRGAEASPAAAEQADYQIVKVFYGTDRKAGKVAEPKARGYLGWFYLTAVSAAVSVMLMLAATRFSRRLPIFVLAGAGVAATLVLGVVTTVARLQGEPPGPRPQRSYGNERGQLEMGICEVSIPQRHRVGEIERPSVFRFEFEEDPRRHVVVLNIEEQPADAFFAGLRARVDASRSKEAFVFVHGFNVTFDEAAHRTAQLAHDLKFDGAPIFFSWPSQGGLLQYAIDETNVVWAVPHLKEFLVGVARSSGAQSVHLIAHSMGNRALTSALQMLSYEMRDEMPMFRQVVLTAPDIDAEVFHRDVVPAITPTAERLTLYASSNDEALKLSKTIHGYRRAGDSGQELLVIPGVDTIDVSTVDTSLIGHEYYGNNATVIADMLDLINESKPPQLRPWLQARRLGELMYWVFHGDSTTLEVSQPATPSIRR